MKIPVDEATARIKERFRIEPDLNFLQQLQILTASEDLDNYGQVGLAVRDNKIHLLSDENIFTGPKQ